MIFNFFSGLVALVDAICCCMSLFAIICRPQIARMIGFYYFLNRVSALWDFVESLCRKTGLAIKAESTFDLQEVDEF